MKIGIFISGRFSEDGGGYTITYDIFNQLIKTIKNKKNFIFILLNDNNNYLKNKLKNFDLDYKDFRENKLIINFKNFLFCYIPILVKFYRFIKKR